MLKSITRTMLTSTMEFAWSGLIRMGESLVTRAERLGADEAYDSSAGFVEMSVSQAGRAMVRSGEALERFVNSVAMLLGYDDGEVAGVVAWPASAH